MALEDVLLLVPESTLTVSLLAKRTLQMEINEDFWVVPMFNTGIFCKGTGGSGHLG